MQKEGDPITNSSGRSFTNQSLDGCRPIEGLQTAQGADGEAQQRSSSPAAEITIHSSASATVVTWRGVLWLGRSGSVGVGGSPP